MSDPEVVLGGPRVERQAGAAQPDHEYGQDGRRAGMVDVRKIITRLRTLYEQRKRLLLLLTDRTSPSRSRLRKLRHELLRILFGSPEWLSWRVETLGEIRRRRQRFDRPVPGEKFHRMFHRWHTIYASVALLLIASVSLIGISFVYGLVVSHQGVAAPKTELVGTLVTLTGVVGGVAGILFAVIVFGIQFHGERLGQASYLARYFGRREGLVPIAAFSLAVVTANACVALLSSHGFPHTALLMAYLDYLLVPLVLILLLVLLHRMVVSVSADIFDRSLVPGLCWEYERAIDEEIHHAGLIKECEKVLADVGFRYSCGAGMIDVDPVAPVKFTLPGQRQVTDVKLTALRDLAAYIHARCPEYEGVVAIGPEDVLDNTVVFILSARRDDQGRQKRDTPPPPEECRHEIHRRLRLVFRLGRVRERDVVEVLARFEKTIVSQARHDRADQLERGFGALERLVELRLQRGESWERHPSFRRKRLADPLEGFEYYDMAANAVASGDREKVSALLLFSCRMMGLAVKHEHPSLYYCAGQIIVAIYYRAIEGKELADYVGERIDGWLSTLGSQFEYTTSSWRLDPPKIAAQMPVLMVDLAWRLELVRAALEAGRTNDATNFQDRLFRWDEHSGKRFADPHEEASVPLELREACDLMSFAALHAAGWSLHLVESKHEHAETAKAVFQRCASDLGSREHLLRLWEAVRSKSFTGRPLDDPFGVTRWTMASPARTGVCVTGFVSDAWIERGFMALMLARPSSPKYEVPEAMHACPPFRPKSPDEVKTLADSILANDAVRKELLNITDEKRDDALNTVVALLRERLRLFRLDRLDTVVSTPLRDEHRIRLRAQVAKELEDEYGLTSTLAKLGGLQDDAQSWFLPRIQYEVWLQKDSVVDCREHPMDFAPLIARSIEKREDTRITHAAERIATPMTTIQRLANLADAVRDAVARLRRTTKNPILIFVPQERRIIEAIIGHQGWQLPNRGELGGNHIGDWPGCHLLLFPYINPSSIVIVDALAFYGSVEESVAARLELEIQHPKKDEHDDWWKQAQAETDATKIPETDAVMVLAVARFSSGVGLRDPNAALRVDLNLTQIGFAMVQSERVYHRPGCGLLSAAEGEIVHTLAHRLRSGDEPRAPCEQCRPDTWEEQSEHEAQDALSAE